MTARSNPELGLDRPTSEPDEYLAKAQARTGPKRQFEECLVFCYFQACTFDTMVKTLNSLTGGQYDTDAIVFKHQNRVYSKNLSLQMEGFSLLAEQNKRNLQKRKIKK